MEHASWPIRQDLRLQQKSARELKQSTQISRDTHAGYIRRYLSAGERRRKVGRRRAAPNKIKKGDPLVTCVFGRLEAGKSHASWDIRRSLHLPQKWARGLKSKMSTRAKTLSTNHQKLARKLKHSKEFASASEINTRAEKPTQINRHERASLNIRR